MKFPIIEMVASFVELFWENIVTKKCLISNAFSLLPANETELKCLNAMNFCLKPKLDFNDERLFEPNNVHFLDEPSLKGNNDTLRAAHAVLLIH